MAAAAVLELQRAQSLLSTDREASIGILHSIGERPAPRPPLPSPSALPAAPSPAPPPLLTHRGLRAAARPGPGPAAPRLRSEHGRHGLRARPAAAAAAGPRSRSEQPRGRSWPRGWGEVPVPGLGVSARSGRARARRRFSRSDVFSSVSAAAAESPSELGCSGFAPRVPARSRLVPGRCRCSEGLEPPACSAGRAWCRNRQCLVLLPCSDLCCHPAVPGKVFLVSLLELGGAVRAFGVVCASAFRWLFGRSRSSAQRLGHGRDSQPLLCLGGSGVALTTLLGCFFFLRAKFPHFG